MARRAIFTTAEARLRNILLDHVIRAPKERRRHGEPNRLGGFEVDHQLELGGLLHGQVGGLGAFQDLVDIGRSAPRVLDRA